ncbi:MAG: hypothetical protein HZR80_18755 [Candidatus Heimdallarchaeota archaeon]
MKNKLLIPLIVGSVLGLVGTASMTGVFIFKQGQYTAMLENYQQLDDSFTDLETTIAELQNNYTSLENNYTILCVNNTELQAQYDDLYEDHQELIDNYNDLNDAYTVLNGNYNTLQDAYDLLFDLYNQLIDDYADLSDQYNYVSNELDAFMYYIKTLPICDKMTFYYHICRSYLYPQIGPLEFAKDLILHSSYQVNYLSAVDDILEEYDFWEFGSSMDDAWEATTNVYSGWLSYWSGLNWEEEIFDWIRFTSGIVYQYDSQYSYNRNYNFDYFKAPLEMLNNRAGDCDDFSLLGGTMFENNGYDVKFAVIHDDIYYPGELHHAWLWVNVDYDRWTSNFDGNPIWTFNGGLTYEWLIVDLTPNWQGSIWQKPGWLAWYADNGVTSSMWRPLEDSINVDV